MVINVSPSQSVPVASLWLQRHVALLPSDADAAILDLACGGGRNARFLRQAAYQVLALDKDERGFADLAAIGITTLSYDLEHTHSVLPFADASLAGIVVCNYLHRPLFAELQRCLKPAGVLIYETFMDGQQALGKPSRPEFLLQSNELLNLAQAWGWQILAFEQGGFASADSLERGLSCMRQRLCARKPG